MRVVSLVKPREVNCVPNDQRWLLCFACFFLRIPKRLTPQNWCSLEITRSCGCQTCWQPFRMLATQTKIGHKRDPFKIGIKTDRHPGDQGLAGRFVVLPRFLPNIWASLQYCYLVLSANDLGIVVKLITIYFDFNKSVKKVKVGTSIKMLVHSGWKIYSIIWREAIFLTSFFPLL